MKDQNPFLEHNFFEALERSGSIGRLTGWEPVTFNNNSSQLTTYIKSHSYGEYIFDWGWAEAYERHGIPYYPKLTSMVPFTPVTTRRLHGGSEDIQKLLNQHEDLYNDGPFSSSHFLFIEPDEAHYFREMGYMTRLSLQYHFINQDYKSFDDFLSNLKSKKAKTIRKERNIPGISFHHYSGHDLKDYHARRMYEFYISTITKKNSFDYLNRDFFERLFSLMKEKILYIEAEENGAPIAGSLFLFSNQKLYGRYWGSTKFVENLHFELCYYQGIEYCIAKKLKVFEAGAQGEHKLLRGFEPVKTYSTHKIKHDAFNVAIKNFIEKESYSIEKLQIELAEHLPYKKKGP